MQPEDIGRLVLEHKWYALAAVLIGLVIRLLNEDTKIPITIPPRLRAPLALALGIVTGLLGKLADGQTWTSALTWGVGAAVTAIMGHVLVIKSLAGGKEVPLPGLTKKDDDKPADPPTKPNGPPPLPTAMMLICIAIVALWSVFILGCGAGQQTVVRNAARADILLVADGAVKMQSLCADLAMQKKDLELAKACAASYDGTRVTLLAAETLVDSWDSASAGHYMCTMAHAGEALAQGVRAFTLAGGKVPPAIDDALAAIAQLSKGCSVEGGG